MLVILMDTSDYKKIALCNKLLDFIDENGMTSEFCDWLNGDLVSNA